MVLRFWEVTLYFLLSSQKKLKYVGWHKLVLLMMQPWKIPSRRTIGQKLKLVHRKYSTNIKRWGWAARLLVRLLWILVVSWGSAGQLPMTEIYWKCCHHPWLRMLLDGKRLKAGRILMRSVMYSCLISCSLPWTPSSALSAWALNEQTIWCINLWFPQCSIQQKIERMCNSFKIIFFVRWQIHSI